MSSSSTPPLIPPNEELRQRLPLCVEWTCTSLGSSVSGTWKLWGLTVNAELLVTGIVDDDHTVPFVLDLARFLDDTEESEEVCQAFPNLWNQMIINYNDASEDQMSIELRNVFSRQDLASGIFVLTSGLHRLLSSPPTNITTNNTPVQPLTNILYYTPVQQLQQVGRPPLPITNNTTQYSPPQLTLNRKRSHVAANPHASPNASDEASPVKKMFSQLSLSSSSSSSSSDFTTAVVPLAPIVPTQYVVDQESIRHRDECQTFLLQANQDDLDSIKNCLRHVGIDFTGVIQPNGQPLPVSFHTVASQTPAEGFVTTGDIPEFARTVVNEIQHAHPNDDVVMSFELDHLMNFDIQQFQQQYHQDQDQDHQLQLGHHQNIQDIQDIQEIQDHPGDPFLFPQNGDTVEEFDINTAFQ